jgi:uncharacterized protein YcbK (DUF882 family)
MADKVYKKGENVTLSPHFKLNEFQCPCSECATVEVDPDLIITLEALRSKVNHPLRINSGYRCQNYQNELRLRGYETSLGISQHTLGRAADVMSEDSRLSGVALETLARQCGFTSVGVGHNWIHVDLRPGYRRWEYVKR